MNDKQKSIIRRSLLEEIEELKEQIAVLFVLTEPIAPDCSVDRLTAGSGIEANGKVLQSAQKRLVLLERALKEIDIADYGICKLCGKEISFDRLIMIPEAKFCNSGPDGLCLK